MKLRIVVGILLVIAIAIGLWFSSPQDTKAMNQTIGYGYGMGVR